MTTEAGQNLRSESETATGDFQPEQKRYLEGFVAGLQIAKTAKGVGVGVGAAGTASAGAATPAPEPVGPDAAARLAQDRVLAAGGKLSDPEKFKREENPLDTYERLKDLAARNEYPKPPDNFRWRFFGLFYVAPNQNSYMCRLRIPNGIVKAHAVRRPCRSRRALRRRLRACDDARQYPDPRDRSQERRRHDRGGAGSGPHARAAPAPTISATSPARRPPASTAKS